MPALSLSEAPKTGPFQAGTPPAAGDLLSAEHVADLLGLSAAWQANRLWCLGRLAAVATPDGKARFFSRSVEEYAAAGMPNAVPRYSTPDEFLRGSEDERGLARTFEAQLSNFVSRHPMKYSEQRKFIEAHGTSGWRDVKPAGEVLQVFNQPVAESHFSMPRIPAAVRGLEAEPPLSALGSVGVAVLGYHLRQSLFYAAEDRPHHFPGGLLAGLFRSQRDFNSRISEALDAVSQKKFGYRAGRYAVGTDGAWNHQIRAYDTRVVNLDVTECIRGTDLLQLADRRAIVQCSL